MKMRGNDDNDDDEDDDDNDNGSSRKSNNKHELFLTYFGIISEFNITQITVFLVGFICKVPLLD
jgi:hypothetical protein